MESAAMGLFDALSRAFGGDDGQGGMGAMLEHLAANGCAERVEAWTTGGKMPISADQLGAALGNEQVEQMAGAAGQSAEDFLEDMADHLSNKGATPPSDNQAPE
jgi:uncharacterized protein YidB (DUF937 family)